jgi:hypothetical protein
METKTESLSELIRLLTAPNPMPLDGTNGVMRLPTKTGIVFETNEETYDHFLDALPVHYMHGSLFCFAEGFAPFTLFFRRNKRYCVRQLSEEETEEFCRLADIPRAVYA